MAHLGTFSGMPGVEAPEIEGPFVRSVSAFAKALTRHRLVAASDDNGSITVYVDDAGAYRAIFQRYMVTLSEQTFTSKAQVKTWLAEWFPKLSD